MLRHLLSGVLLLLLVSFAYGCQESGSGCPVGTTNCGIGCIQTATDRNNCGRCGIVCLDGQYCAGGICLTCENECASAQMRCVPGTTNQYQSCGDPDGDTCLEWEAAQYCPGGETCDNGTCIKSCSDECATGERQCYADGWRVCGQYDADHCLDWSNVTPCRTGELCDAVTAQCVGGCQDECVASGDRRCIPDPVEEGYEICGDYDSDACLEWGGRVLCPLGQTCDNQTGFCSSTCTDDCTSGERICDGNGFRVCGHYDADPCLDWSGITLCASYEICNAATGQCETGCTNECPAVGNRRCSGDGFDVCGDYDADTCLEWGGHQACQAGFKCEGGQCIPDTCQDECGPQGARICDGSGYRTCVSDADLDSCLEWSNVTPCDAGQTCSNGDCTEVCQDECTSVGMRECVGNGWRQCGEFDNDACTDWSQITECAQDQICDPQAGQCVSGCTSECNAGARECRENGYVDCGNYDADPCLEWSGVRSCPAGQVCEPATGNCIEGCTDECTTPLAQTCSGDGYDICGNYDADSCLEWGNHQICPDGTTCSGGECLEWCTDECAALGQQVCDQSANGYQICGFYDSDPCLDLSDTTLCAYNEVCQSGSCLEICQDECALGEKDCVGDAWRECGNYDPDPCREWSGQTTCQADRICYRGYCIADTPPAQVVINEILYDDAYDPDSAFAFVELHGPAGLSLDNYLLTGLDGTNGVEYVQIELDGYTLPDDGHFVIAHDLTMQDPIVIDMWDSRIDMQNGPDSVRVTWGGSVIVDALGYGDHSGGQVFGGEGSPAVGAEYDQANDIVRCLSRKADHTDTDDNSVDFSRRNTCTPGWEGPGTILWQAYVYGGLSTPAIDDQGNIFTVDKDGDPNRTDPQGNASFYLLGSTDGYSSIALSWDSQTAYLGTSDGLYALDASNLEPLSGWGPVEPGCSVFATPTVDPVQVPLDGTIYFGNQCDKFLAVNPDGSTKWSYTASGPIGGSAARINWSTGEQFVLFCTVASELVCLDAETGLEAWFAPAPLGGACNSSPAVGMDGTVYVGANDGYLYAFNGYTGVSVSGFPVPVHDTVSATDTRVRGCSPVTAPASDYGELIFMTSMADSGNLFIYRSDGTQLYAGTLPDGNSSATLAANSTFLLHTADRLAAYSWPATEEWSTTIGDTEYGWIKSSPAIGPDDIVYVVEYKGTDTGGYLYAIQGDSALFTGQGSYPKFRGDAGNTGWGY